MKKIIGFALNAFSMMLTFAICFASGTLYMIMLHDGPQQAKDPNEWLWVTCQVFGFIFAAQIVARLIIALYQWAKS